MDGTCQLSADKCEYSHDPQVCEAFRLRLERNRGRDRSAKGEDTKVSVSTAAAKRTVTALAAAGLAGVDEGAGQKDKPSAPERPRKPDEQSGWLSRLPSARKQASWFGGRVKAVAKGAAASVVALSPGTTNNVLGGAIALTAPATLPNISVLADELGKRNARFANDGGFQPLVDPYGRGETPPKRSTAAMRDGRGEIPPDKIDSGDA